MSIRIRIRMLQVVPILALFVLSCGCGKKEQEQKTDEKKKEKTTQPAGTADKPPATRPVAAGKPVARKPETRAVVGSWKKVPNIKSIWADVPAFAKPNGAGGAAGFHSADGSYSFILRMVSGKQASETFKKAKKDAKALLFKKWIKSEKTDKGWVLTYMGKKPGPPYNFSVRLELAGKKYNCYGGLKKKDHLDKVVKTCQTLQVR